MPRLSDLVQDLLSMIGRQSPEHDTEVLVLDFSDAFWQIPLAVCERRHFIGTYGGKLWKFKRAAQGSRNTDPFPGPAHPRYYSVARRVCLQECHLTPDTRRREHNSTSTIRPSPYPEHKNLRMTLWPLPCSFGRSWDSDSPSTKLNVVHQSYGSAHTSTSLATASSSASQNQN